MGKDIHIFEDMDIDANHDGDICFHFEMDIDGVVDIRYDTHFYKGTDVDTNSTVRIERMSVIKAIADGHSRRLLFH